MDQLPKIPSFKRPKRRRRRAMPMAIDDLATWMSDNDHDKCPDWRWRFATYIIDHPRQIPRRWRDEWVIRAMAFQRAMRKAMGLSEEREVSRDFPEEYHSYGIFSNSNQTLRHVLEAYLCSGAGVEDIGKKLHLPTATVLTYAKLFFNVLGSTCDWVYVLCNVLGERFTNKRLRQKDVPLIWKWIAMLKGPIALEMMIQMDLLPGRVGSPSMASAAVQDLIGSATTVKTLLATYMLSPKRHGRALLKAYARQQEIAAKQRSTGEAVANPEEGLEVVIATLAYTTAGLDGLSDEQVVKHQETLFNIATDRGAIRTRLAQIVPTDHQPAEGPTLATDPRREL